MSRQAIVNRLGRIFVQGKSESEVANLIIMDKTVDDLIELLRGCDIASLYSAVVKKLEEMVRGGTVLSPLQKKQLLLNILNSGTTVEETFSGLCQVLIDGDIDSDQPPHRENTCKICFSKDISTVFLPCGHVLACEDCANRVGRCPFCRASSRPSIKKIYFG